MEDGGRGDEGKTKVVQVVVVAAAVEVEAVVANGGGGCGDHVEEGEGEEETEDHEDRAGYEDYEDCGDYEGYGDCGDRGEVAAEEGGGDGAHRAFQSGDDGVGHSEEVHRDAVHHGAVRVCHVWGALDGTYDGPGPNVGMYYSLQVRQHVHLEVEEGRNDGGDGPRYHVHYEIQIHQEAPQENRPRHRMKNLRMRWAGL